MGESASSEYQEELEGGGETWETSQSSVSDCLEQSLESLEQSSEQSLGSPQAIVYSLEQYDIGEYAGMNQQQAFSIAAAGIVAGFMVTMFIMFISYGVDMIIKTFRKGV